MMIFAFPMVPLSSNKIAIVVCMGIMLIQPQYAKIYYNIIKKKNVLRVALMLGIVSVYTAFITSIYGEYDYSLFEKQISSAIYLLLIILVYSVLDRGDIPRLIVYSMILQSTFILLSIISVEFYELTNAFRFELSENHQNAYSNFRGNAISGYQFFGIGAMFALTIVYMFIEENIATVSNSLLLGILISIGFLASRYSILITLMAAIVWFVYIADKKNRAKYGFYFIVTSIGILSIFYYLYVNVLDLVIKSIIDYQVVNPIRRIFTSGTIEISSFTGLLEMYDNINLNNLFLGEGRYTSRTGGYFRGVDPGYLRIVYYYGAIGTGVIYWTLYKILSMLSLNSKRNNLLVTTLFISFLILNIKGDVLFYSNNVLPLIIGFLLFENKVNSRKHA
jgi:hypothetical protein